MRLKREKNFLKLSEAKIEADKLQAKKMQLLNERDIIQGAIRKAEHRQKYSELNKRFFQAVKEVRKRSRLLGYSEKEIEAIVDEFYYPDGRPALRVPTT